jgi:integrase/recombinase XerD
VSDPAPGRDALGRQLDEYATWLAVERGLSTNTLAAYRRDLRRYTAWLRSRGVDDLTAVGEAEVVAYVESLKAARDADGGAKYAPSSVARALVAVRSFHRVCVDEGITDVDPSGEVGAPRVPQGIPKALSETEVDALLGAVEGDDPRALRDRAILETLYGTGVRISELVGLDRVDLDLEDRLMRVLGKGSKERVVPVGGSAQRALLAYLERGRPALERPSTRRVPGDPLLLTLKGRSCIERADVLIYDYLCNPELLNFAKPGVEKIYAGKKAGAHTLKQDEINALIVEKTREGKTVTRLKGGDPFLFGRGGEEAEAMLAKVHAVKQKYPKS